MQTDGLKKWYDALIENPLQIFIVMPDGQIFNREKIHQISDINEGTFSLTELSVIPGSFNPLHNGHRFMYDWMPGMQSSNKKVFEISIRRMGKPDLSVEELAERIAQFEFYAPVIITNAARFIEKCACFPYIDITWHIGIDTISRMRDDYGELGIAGLRGGFCVWDRDMGNGLEQYPLDFKFKPRNVYRCLKDIPEVLRGISSTKIRAGLIK